MSEQAEPVQSGQTSLREMTWWGRPPKLKDDQKREVYNALMDYIHDTDDPTLPDFVTSNDTAIGFDVTTQNLKDWQEFSSLIKRVVTKQEAYLLKHAGSGKYNPTIAIFRLKQPQHGYRDRYETDVTSGGDKIGMTPEQSEQLIRLRAANAGS